VKAPSSAQAQAFFEIAKAVKDGVLSA